MQDGVNQVPNGQSCFRSTSSRMKSTYSTESWEYTLVTPAVILHSPSQNSRIDSSTDVLVSLTWHFASKTDKSTRSTPYRSHTRRGRRRVSLVWRRLQLPATWTPCVHHLRSCRFERAQQLCIMECELSSTVAFGQINVGVHVVWVMVRLTVALVDRIPAGSEGVRMTVRAGDQLRSTLRRTEVKGSLKLNLAGSTCSCVARGAPPSALAASAFTACNPWAGSSTRSPQIPADGRPTIPRCFLISLDPSLAGRSLATCLDLLHACLTWHVFSARCKCSVAMTLSTFAKVASLLA